MKTIKKINVVNKDNFNDFMNMDDKDFNVCMKEMRRQLKILEDIKKLRKNFNDNLKPKKAPEKVIPNPILNQNMNPTTKDM